MKRLFDKYGPFLAGCAMLGLLLFACACSGAREVANGPSGRETTTWGFLKCPPPNTPRLKGAK